MFEVLHGVYNEYCVIGKCKQKTQKRIDGTVNSNEVAIEGEGTEDK